MYIIAKYILKSALEKKSRLVLILTSIMISIALLIGALMSYESTKSMLETHVRSVYNEFNVKVQALPGNESDFFAADFLDDATYEKTFKSIDIIGTYAEAVNIKFVGTTQADIGQMSAVYILDETEEKGNFTENGIMVSQDSAKVFGWETGDSIDVNILGRTMTFQVTAICATTGLFYLDTAKELTVFTNRLDVLDLYETDQEIYNDVLLSVDTADINGWIRNFNEENANSLIEAVPTIDENTLSEQVAWMRIPLSCMIVIIMILTVFIISSTFKLIIQDRLHILGIFLSQGCTDKKLRGLLYTEGLFYGVFGGILGCGAGIGVGVVISNAANMLKEYNIRAEISLNPLNFLFGFAAAIVLSFTAVYFSTLALKKFAVKEIILNRVESQRNQSNRSFLLGVLCFAMVIVLCLIGPSTGNIGALPSLFLFFIGMFFVLPKIMALVLTFVQKIMKRRAVTLYLACNNVRSSPYLKSTTMLVTVCLTAVIMLISANNAIVASIYEAYTGMDFEQHLRTQGQAQSLEAINDIMLEYENDGKIHNVVPLSNVVLKMDNNAEKLITAITVDPSSYIHFEDYVYYTDKKSQLAELSRERGIIITRQLAAIYNIRQGDTIEVTYGDRTTHLEILSLFDARMLGNYNIISFETAEELFGITYPTEYYFKSSGNDGKTVQMLTERLQGYAAALYSQDDIIQAEKESVSVLLNVLQLLVWMTVITGSISCLSNYFMSFLQRRKDLALYKVVGMTDRRMNRMLLAEALIQGLFACVFAYASEFCIYRIFYYIFSFMEMDLVMLFPYESAHYILGGTLGLVLLFNLATIFKNKRLSVVQEIKYE